MSVPDFQSFMLPILTLFRDRKNHSIKECKKVVINAFGLTEEDIKFLVIKKKMM